MDEKIDEKNVCSSGWHGKHGSTLILKNENKQPVTVSRDPKCPWPFEYPSSPFTIDAKVGSTPGTRQVKLVNIRGTHCYHTDNCPGDLAVNPKTVIIG